jgi:hypothetical protein
MRFLFAPIFLIALVGIAVAGCSSTNGTGAGSGPRGGNVSNQGPASGTVPSLLIDGGIVGPASMYTGFNTSASDAQGAADAGADTPTTGSYPSLPANPPGSHAITFNGNNRAQILFAYNGAIGQAAGQNGLVMPPAGPGQIAPINYGAVVLFEGLQGGVNPLVPIPPTPAPSPYPQPTYPAVAVEFVGGSGSTQFDVRVGCATAGVPIVSLTVSFERYVCDLPPYGALSGAYSTTYSGGKFATNGVPGTLQDAAASGNATGQFTPTSLEPLAMYAVLGFPELTATNSTGNVLSLDYIYAEQGTQ